VCALPITPQTRGRADVQHCDGPICESVDGARHRRVPGRVGRNPGIWRCDRITESGGAFGWWESSRAPPLRPCPSRLPLGPWGAAAFDPAAHPLRSSTVLSTGVAKGPGFLAVRYMRLQPLLDLLDFGRFRGREHISQTGGPHNTCSSTLRKKAKAHCGCG
jgi:hypothetical protein